MTLTLRDRTEALLRGWNRLETEQGRLPVIDYDCFPGGPEESTRSRVEVCEALADCLDEAQQARDDWLIGRLHADRAYVRALLGERLPLAAYVEATQGAPARGWPAAYIEERKQQAIEALASLGITWDPKTNERLEDTEGRLTAEDTALEIQQQADHFEDRVRRLAGTEAAFTLKVEEVTTDAYWAYWLDGEGMSARLRINMRNAQFTKVRARQLALHEILGHALQGASFHQQALDRDVPWVRVLSVHAPQQILLEGLAQALPLLVAPHDEPLAARTRLVHFTQLVRAEMHLMINEQRPLEECIAYARRQVPFWTPQSIGNILTDRSTSAQLRSYLWSYPAGLDWFVQLADHQPSNLTNIIQACYQAPLQPSELAALWPDGPTIGGPGGR